MAQVAHALNLLGLGLSVGVAFSYVVTLGALFNRLVRQRDWDFFSERYGPFRTQTKAKLKYGLITPAGQILLALGSLLSNWHDRPLAPQALAVLVFPLYYLLLHWPSGFARVEEKLNSGGRLEEPEVTTYLRWNLPLHVVLGLLYMATFVSCALAV